MATPGLSSGLQHDVKSDVSLFPVPHHTNRPSQRRYRSHSLGLRHPHLTQKLTLESMILLWPAEFRSEAARKLQERLRQESTDGGSGVKRLPWSIGVFD